MDAGVMDKEQGVAQVQAAPYYVAQGGECELFEHCYRQQLPLLIKGPTGCGKTRLVEHMAARLGRPLIKIGRAHV